MKASPELRTLTDIFFQVVERDQPRVMLYEQRAPAAPPHPTGAMGTPESAASVAAYPPQSSTGSQWSAISSTGFYQRVMGVVQRLRGLGVSPGQRVAILSENRPEWTIADFAILLCGAVTVPIYATLTPDQICFLLCDSGATVIFISTAEQFTKLRSICAETFVEHVISMDAPSPQAGALSMPEMMQAGPAQRSPELDALGNSISPNDLATIIYTSGTTGVPKGAMLTHGNLCSNLSVALTRFALYPEDLAISFLPLSHITARHVDFAELYRGVTIAYCPVIEELPRLMRQLHPTIFVAVPRVYEKIQSKVLRETAAGWKNRVYRWALAVGRAHMSEVLSGHTPTSQDWRLADRLVFSKLRQAMGGRIRLYISGGAPLGRDLGEWYAQFGIVIHEGYGLTETSPVIAVNVPGACKLGTVGRPVSNLELRIAPDGELLVRGPSVFRGYWNRPEETAEAFDGEWFKTGDIARLDADGFLSITDRKKDLIKTSGGKFIAPQPIENSFRACAYVAEAILVGDRRRFPAIVLFPEFSELEQWALQSGISFASRTELLGYPQVQVLYAEVVERVNRNLAHFEQIKRFLLIAEEVSIADGSLTPTLKLRRRIVEQRHQSAIEQLYSDSSPADATRSA